MFWRLGTNGIRGAPTQISKFWYGLPEDGVDALYERYDGKIVFFKGRSHLTYNLFFPPSRSASSSSLNPLLMNSRLDKHKSTCRQQNKGD